MQCRSTNDTRLLIRVFFHATQSLHAYRAVGRPIDHRSADRDPAAGIGPDAQGGRARPVCLEHAPNRDRITQLSLQLEADDRGRAEKGEVALKVFELSQTLKEKWLTADYRAKRRILEIVCLNFFLRDVSARYDMNKPSGVLAEGLDLAENRGDRI